MLKVDEMGRTPSIQVVHSSIHQLDGPVAQSVSHYRFRPATLDNQPVTTPMPLTVLVRPLSFEPAVLSPGGLPSIPAIDSGPPGWRFPFACDLPHPIRLLILPIPFLCTATASQTAPRCPILNIHSRFRTKSGSAHGLCPNSSTPKWQT